MYNDQKIELLRTCQKMRELEMVIGSSGNVSTRAGEHVVITPSGIPYLKMRAADAVVVDLDANIVEGDHKPSMETPTHLNIYRNHEEVRAIVHSHSVYASALAALRKQLPPVIDEIIPSLGGNIRVAEYGIPGTSELAENVLAALDDRSGVLLANHGSLAIGPSLETAFHNAVLIERACKIYIIGSTMGDLHILPKEAQEVERKMWESQSKT
ncbi:class II aldolase/adducin family protein [Candidatus Thorarchaeota archaeon]|nr:MAG: class II aldolase/adducin family protein [Candidatus Thorarchaeota archaeon]